MKTFLEHKKYFIYHVLGIIISLAFFTTLEKIIYIAIPMKFWVEYENVAPAGDYVVGTQLNLISNAKIRRPVDIEWSDAIRCDCENNHVNSCDETGFYTFSTYNSGEDNYHPKSLTQAWNYPRTKPQHQTQCYIRSTATITFHNGVVKQKTTDGSIFNVVYPNGDQINEFVNKGKRFTYTDGVVLFSILKKQAITPNEIEELYGDNETDFKEYILQQTKQ